MNEIGLPGDQGYSGPYGPVGPKGIKGMFWFYHYSWLKINFYLFV
jgi:hypothetical protein